MLYIDMIQPEPLLGARHGMGTTPSSNTVLTDKQQHTSTSKTTKRKPYDGTDDHSGALMQHPAQQKGSNWPGTVMSQ
jgi:hypothetical protein